MVKNMRYFFDNEGIFFYGLSPAIRDGGVWCGFTGCRPQYGTEEVVVVGIFFTGCRPQYRTEGGVVGIFLRAVARNTGREGV